MNDCMIIRGAIAQDDGSEKTFRPATPTPDKHWAYMLMDQYKHRINFKVKWVDNEPVATITKESHKEDEIAFEHIMQFAKLHNLDVTICESECLKCDGHVACLSNN